MKHLGVAQRSTLIWSVIVFAVAVMMRLPSCYESFWVDELHTAWAIWGDFDQVADRASMGNQTPLYFQLMWFWKAIVGGSELALRMSSVLAVATACVLLVVGVRQTTKSLTAGVLSGVILAIESSSLFFGTEFRPYAFVMLLSVIATWAVVNLLDGESKIRSGNLRLIFVAAVGLATLLHPTAIVTLGVLAAVVLAAGWLQNGLHLRFQISDFGSLILITAVALALVNSSLGDSWDHRSRWAAFGKVTQWRELWVKWPWLTIAIVPTLIRVVGRRPRTRVDIVGAHVPMFAGVLATSVFFLASYFDWVPLWHRRYFIAALPMLAWSAGACAMLVVPVNPRVRQQQVGWAIALGIAGMLFWQQGAWNQFQRTQTWTHPRGEDWRGAVAWLNEQRIENELVYIDGDLIESFDDWQQLTSGYFEFPLLGPYNVPYASHHVLLGDRPRVESQMPLTGGSRWIVSRSAPTPIDRWIENNRGKRLASKQFGRVYVVRYQH